MPYGPGTYGPASSGGRAAALAAPALAQQGIPETLLPQAAPTEQALSELLRMIRGGQAGAERTLELLSLLAASTVPQMDQATQMERGGMKGPGDIAGLLGG